MNCGDLIRMLNDFLHDFKVKHFGRKLLLTKTGTEIRALYFYANDHIKHGIESPNELIIEISRRDEIPEIGDIIKTDRDGDWQVICRHFSEGFLGSKGNVILGCESKVESNSQIN